MDLRRGQKAARRVPGWRRACPRTDLAVRPPGERGEFSAFGQAASYRTCFRNTGLTDWAGTSLVRFVAPALRMPASAERAPKHECQHNGDRGTLLHERRRRDGHGTHSERCDPEQRDAKSVSRQTARLPRVSSRNEV